jgi:phospholipase/carboxylesterase
MTLKFVGPSKPTKKSAVILLHGAGANRHDLAPLRDMLDRDLSYDWFFPEAPICQSPEYNMHIWFPVGEIVSMLSSPRTDLSAMSSHTPPRIAEARDALDGFLKGVLADYEQVVLGGFSQGAMMSMDYFVRHPDRKIKGVILLSGTLADLRTWELISDEAYRAPVFQSHGSEDTVLAERFGKQLLEFLGRKQFPVSYHGFEGGHEIPDHLFKPLQAFIKSSLHA